MSVQSVSIYNNSYSYKNGAGRSDVLSDDGSVFQKNDGTNNSNEDSFNIVDVLFALVSKVGNKLGQLFGVKSSSDSSDVKITKHDCLEEDDPEILAALNEQSNALTTQSATVAANNTQYQDAQSLTAAIYESDDDAKTHMANLCSSLGMTEDEVSAYLINITQSEQYGNGCIDPLTFYAQICQESGGNSSAQGDKNSSGEYLALGLGQFHTVAVDQVNMNIKAGLYGDYTYNNGQDYTYSDRSDAKKSLEMMALLLRYDASKTDDENSMLAMYNQGNANGINTTDGKNYVKAIFSQIGIDINC